MSELHPLFAKVGAEHRWERPLPELLPVLTAQAGRLGADATEQDRENDKDFAWVVLPRGALVAVRRRGDMEMRRELRIARGDALQDRARWLREVDVFCEKFGIRRLDGSTPADANRSCVVELPPTERDAGRTAIRLIELFEGETLPGAGRCYRCWDRKQEHVSVAYVPGRGMHQACEEHAWAAVGDALDEAKRRKAGTP